MPKHDKTHTPEKAAEIARTMTPTTITRFCLLMDAVRLIDLQERKLGIAESDKFGPPKPEGAETDPDDIGSGNDIAEYIAANEIRAFDALRREGAFA